MKLIIEVEFTEEDLRAGNFELHGAPEWTMEASDLRRFILEPAIQRKLHSIRSNLRWNELKVWEQLPCTHATRSGEWIRPTIIQPMEGEWECTSPTKLCWYDAQRDSCWDSCLFCGDPAERK